MIDKEQEGMEEEMLEQVETEKAEDTEIAEEVEIVSEEGIDAKLKKDKKEKKEKKEKKDKKTLQIEELNDKLIRFMAEFDNFRKRSEKEKSQMFEIGAKDIIEKMLPIVDNFERGIDVLTEEELQGAFAQGMEKIYRQLVSTLEGAGVIPIEAVGKEFDPNLHNAVMHIEDGELESNIVVEEFQKGYLYRESVVRHSMVKVAN